MPAFLGGAVPASCAGAVPASSEHEQDQEAEQTGRLGEREAQEGERRDLRRGIARQRVDERGEDEADADAGAREREAGEAGTDHFGSCEFHEMSSGLKVTREPVAAVPMRLQ